MTKESAVQSACSPKETRLAVQKLHELPAMSLVVQQFLRAIQDANLEVRQLAAIIERDPGLSARLVGIANSAYFGYPEEVRTAEEAIFNVLGLNTAKSLALGIVLSGPFNAGRCPSFRLDIYWANAILVGLLAQRLAPSVEASPKPTSGEAYLAGLLHNVGLLALVHLSPEQLNPLFSPDGFEQEQVLRDREREGLGTDHLEVGGWLARKWHLPGSVTTVIEHHLEPDYAGEHWPLARLIGFSVMGADALYRGDDAIELDMRGIAGLGVPQVRIRRVFDDLRERREEIVALSQTLARR